MAYVNNVGSVLEGSGAPYGTVVEKGPEMIQGTALPIGGNPPPLGNNPSQSREMLEVSSSVYRHDDGDFFVEVRATFGPSRRAQAKRWLDDYLTHAFADVEERLG